MVDSAYVKLDVWQRSMDLVVTVYHLTKSFPKEEVYTLTNQARRAAISIPSNIAEGRSKRTTREFMRYVNIACGSTAEVETQIMLGMKLGYITVQQAEPVLDEIGDIGRMLNKLYSSLEAKLDSSDISPLASNL